MRDTKNVRIHNFLLDLQILIYAFFNKNIFCSNLTNTIRNQKSYYFYLLFLLNFTQNF